MTQSDNSYEAPSVSEYGSVESITLASDKIGSSEDDVNFGDLDGSIVPDA
jgi:hypothetical protein